MRLFYTVISIMPAICGAAAGQLTSTPDAPLTPREREMLERIQRLEERIAPGGVSFRPPKHTSKKHTTKKHTTKPVKKY